MSLEATIHGAQAKILRELLFHPQANYALLQKPTGLSSDHFNFHISRLVLLGLVEKVARGMYRLTPSSNENSTEVIRWIGALSGKMRTCISKRLDNS